MKTDFKKVPHTIKSMAGNMTECVREYLVEYNKYYKTTLVDKVIVNAFRIGFLAGLESAGYSEEFTDRVMEEASDELLFLTNENGN